MGERRAGGAWSGGGRGDTEVILSLHSVHNVQHSPNESYYGMASNHALEAEIPVTSERPAHLSAGIDSIVSVRVFLHNRGAPTASDRPVGQLSIPVREMTEICGQGIYQTWFVLEPPEPYGNTQHSLLVDRFRKAMYVVGQEPHAARICLSLLDSSQPSDWGKFESDRERSTFYSPLLVSHTQHAKLARAYFDHLEHLAAGPDSKGKHSGSRGPPEPEALQSKLERLQQQQRGEEVESLRRELDQMTEEANRRIEKGNESIVKLKAELKQKRDEEGPELQRERDAAAARVDAARRAGRELQAQLEKAGDAWDASKEAELERLRVEAATLGKQKAALMKMVQDVYGTGASTAAKRDSGQQLLPSPSELLGQSGASKPL